MLLVLGETLIGLDRAHVDGILLTSGAPYVLQIWLMERLFLFTHPLPPLRPLSYDQLEVFFPFLSIESVEIWLRGLSPADICWFCPRWIYCSVTVRLPGKAGVWLPGLHAITFYLPSRVVRQYGLLQDVPDDVVTGLLRGSVLRPSSVAAFAAAWHERVAAPFRRIPAHTTPTTEFQRWIQTVIEG